MNKKKNKTNIFIALLLALFIIYGIWTIQFERLSLRIGSPFFYTADWVSNIGKNIKIIFVPPSIDVVDEISNLKDDLKTLKIENLYLSSELEYRGIRKTIDKDVVRAAVLLSPPRTRFDKLVIGKGAEEGILSGAVVYSKLSSPIGVVADATKSYAVVELFSSPTKSTNISLNDFVTSGSGVGGGGFVFKVPKDIEIVIGDTVYYQGDTSLPFAEVVKIDSKDADPQKSIHATLFVNLNNLSEVFVSTEVERIDELYNIVGKAI